MWTLFLSFKILHLFNTFLKKVKLCVSPETIIRDEDRTRGVHGAPCVVPKKSIFRNNCATLYVINPRGYTQICAGLLSSVENGRESPLRFNILNVKITFYYPVHV